MYGNDCSMKFFLHEFGNTFDTILYYVDDAHHQSDSMDSVGFTSLQDYSHSMVAGGFELTSYVTRSIPRTSLMILDETFLSKA